MLRKFGYTVPFLLRMCKRQTSHGKAVSLPGGGPYVAYTIMILMVGYLTEQFLAEFIVKIPVLSKNKNFTSF